MESCRIISPNMKKGNSTNDSNCHGKLLPQTTRSPILQVFDRVVYDSHYLNCSAMLGELLVPLPPTLSTLGFALTVTRTIPMARHPPTTPFLVQNATLTNIHAWVCSLIWEKSTWKPTVCLMKKLYMECLNSKLSIQAYFKSRLYDTWTFFGFIEKLVARKKHFVCLYNIDWQMLSVNAVTSCAILNQSFFWEKSSSHNINLDVAMFAANVWWEKMAVLVNN